MQFLEIIDKIFISATDVRLTVWENPFWKKFIEPNFEGRSIINVN